MLVQRVNWLKAHTPQTKSKCHTLTTPKNKQKKPERYLTKPNCQFGLSGSLVSILAELWRKIALDN